MLPKPMGQGCCQSQMVKECVAKVIFSMTSQSQMAKFVTKVETGERTRDEKKVHFISVPLKHTKQPKPQQL